MLGIFFDWENIALPILDGCLPRLANNVVEGGAAFYVNDQSMVIASTDVENFPVGSKFDGGGENVTLEPGDTASGLFTQNGRRYILGSSKTKGYREYGGLGWTAHVVRAIV